MFSVSVTTVFTSSLFRRTYRVQWEAVLAIADGISILANFYCSLMMHDVIPIGLFCPRNSKADQRLLDEVTCFLMKLLCRLTQISV